MNIRLLMIVLIVAMGASFARNTISWNTQTETWVKYFESGVNNHHRSGLVHETDKTFDENAPLSELPDGEENAPSGKMAKLWRTGALGEYKAIYAAPSEKMVAFLKKKCFKNLARLIHKHF
jgi:hypothetical protein